MIDAFFMYMSPIFGQSDKEGKVTFENIPPGEYELRVWTPPQKQSQSRDPKDICGGESTAYPEHQSSQKNP